MGTVFSVRLIDPVSLQLSPTESNFIGNVNVGNTVELIFSKELTNKYDSVAFVSDLPTGFDYETKNELETIKLIVSVPKNAVIGDYPFTVALSGPNGTDKVLINFNVVSDALVVSESNIAEQTANVNSSASYSLFFKNKSQGNAIFVITSDLPEGWMTKDALSKTKYVRTIVVPKESSLDVNFEVFPRLEGKKKFNFKVEYGNTSSDFSFAIDAKPTLESKLEAITYGLPFYSFSLLPSYFLNGLISMILP
ncbi:MAG: hypothetical protein WCW44_00680 [archaeon]|jgi:hypothetical protein